jgi:endonuclease YncB( thermonuclease family)
MLPHSWRPAIVRPTQIYVLLWLAVISLAANAEVVGGRAEVIDGDSIRINGVEMRIHGIDAQESRQTCDLEGVVWDCGRNATNALSEMLGNVTTRCTWSERDAYERLLATCFNNGKNINANMVLDGMAIAYVY